MKMLFTKSFINYLLKPDPNLPISEPSVLPTAIIIEDCPTGGHCQQSSNFCFPFQVLKYDNDQARNNPTLTKVEDPSIPPNIEIYLGKELFGGFVEPLIIDYLEVNGTDFPYIPPIPRPLAEYDFYKFGT
jgi:hypothetical protein